MNPASWWKTYSFALGSYWFNPYLPFGASSCTSLAQRQSDAIREAAKVYGVKALTVAILDDFLLVVKRRKAETDDNVLARSIDAVQRFDNLLFRLNLPKAPEKDQAPSFTTIWCGIEFDSKSGCYGVPKSKWKKLKSFFNETFREKNGSLKCAIEAGVLERALGKFHYYANVWYAGRPPLYALWKVFFQALIKREIRRRNRVVTILRNPKQLLYFDEAATDSLNFWTNRLLDERIPRRIMLRCGKRLIGSWINLFRLARGGTGGGANLFLSFPAVSTVYSEERLVSSEEATDPKSLSCVWLELILEALQALSVHGGMEAVFVRTNIRNLHTIINKQLYVKETRASAVSSEIHARLQEMGTLTSGTSLKLPPPVELRCALLPAPHILK